MPLNQCKRFSDWKSVRLPTLMVAIKQGILTPSTKAVLEQAEADRAALTARTTKTADSVVRLLPNLRVRFRALVGGLATLPAQHVDEAREVVKSLLGTTIGLHPTEDGAERYLMAEITRDYGITAVGAWTQAK